MASKTTAKPKATGRPVGAKEWTFPKNTLEATIPLVQALEEKNAGKPLPAPDLAPLVGFRLASDWRFGDLLRSANLYGLLSGTRSAPVALEKIGEGIVAPTSPSQRQQALLTAFEHVELFKKVRDFYQDKKLPEDEYFSNTLVRDFGVPRERVPTFITVFRSNLEYLRAFAAGGTVRAGRAQPTEEERATVGTTETVATGDTSSIREFLDSCFVMMPFDEWKNRYYKEIFVPAIKDAGLEPVRADDLFVTGSVMEQIWEQIQKAKVLVAELTDKNPNVFYELGLAHASTKPVVFVSAKLEDVPFDLRHLRVILYDTREPHWADRLRKNITQYLRNTREDPTKSIPQPFRDHALTTGVEDDESDD